MLYIYCKNETYFTTSMQYIPIPIGLKYSSKVLDPNIDRHGLDQEFWWFERSLPCKTTYGYKLCLVPNSPGYILGDSAM